MKKYIPFILAALVAACEPTELYRDDAVLTTGDAAGITSSSAHLCGEIVTSQSCTVWFELSENSEMTDSWKTSSVALESGNHLNEVTISAVKLSPNTTYYYRLCGKLDYEGYSMLAGKGKIRSFTTDKYPPAKVKVYVNTPSDADFVDYFVVENGEVVENGARHSFDGYDSSRKMRYIKTTTAISDAGIYMCQLTNEDLSDYKAVSFNLSAGPFYYGHTTVSSIEPEAVCEMRPATSEVKFNITCKSQNGYVDDGGIYQISLVNADGGKTLPICSSATCDLSTGHVTGVTDAKATVSAYTDIWLNSNDTQKASFPAVIPATAGEGEAELWFYVKSQNVDSPIKVAMPSFEWHDGNTYTYNVTLNYTPQTIEMVIGACTIEPWGDEEYVDDLSTEALENGHDYVDLGLSVKWATCNVGASKPEDYGDYFAWGAVEPWYKDGYAQSDSPVWKSGKNGGYTVVNCPYWASGESYGTAKFSKYVTDSSYGTIDNRTVLELSDDAARANWGGSWRMPTEAESYELIDKCTWHWTAINGKNGYKVVSDVNGNSIFLPAAGIYIDTRLFYVGSDGFFWLNSLQDGGPHSAKSFGFISDHPGSSSDSRGRGLSVRPVLP